MSRDDHQLPPLLPTLSRGKHRSPRKGACFMEFASLLAGERWSDHPACTHPLLAAVARHVNDYTSEVGRSRLVELIPSVIGLTGEDLHIDAAVSAKRFRQQAAPTIVRTAVSGVGLACVPDPDGMLRDLLIGAIDACAAWTRRDPGLDATLDPAVWAAACQRTGGSSAAEATGPFL